MYVHNITEEKVIEFLKDKNQQIEQGDSTEIEEKVFTLLKGNHIESIWFEAANATPVLNGLFGRFTELVTRALKEFSTVKCIDEKNIKRINTAFPFLNTKKSRRIRL